MMAETATAPLYTPQLLAMAVELAVLPLLGPPALRGEARSRTCGGTIVLDLLTASDGTVAKVGLRASACAIGQAAAAIFAQGAPGMSGGELASAAEDVAAWLAGGPLPSWPRLDALEPARAHPGRHGAILLPWRAAGAALSKAPPAG
jgi:NifU-like protein involved in Fe-S cluster formation